jgi:hypothetical protein
MLELGWVTDGAGQQALHACTVCNILHMLQCNILHSTWVLVHRPAADASSLQAGAFMVLGAAQQISNAAHWLLA